MKNKIVGILGGMGPESTVHLFHKIIKATPIQKEQDHLRIIIDNNPQIPDRTEAILGLGESPLKELQKTARNLEKFGAELIVIPCNTAHHYYDDIQQSVNVPIINMIEETVAQIKRELPQIKRLGLLATTGTVKAKIYHNILKGIEILTPGKESQASLMDAIYGENGIKAGYTKGRSRKIVLEISKLLLSRRAEAVIAGCTEISLVLKQKDLPVLLFDPLDILAESIVKMAKISN